MLLCCCIAFIGCSEEPGRVRAQRNQLIGMYETRFDQGQERLELRSDGTYVQEFHSAQNSIRHTGRWEAETHLLGGTDVTLIDALLSENDKGNMPQRTGSRILNVHKRSGKLALALNESADWYFERLQ